MLRFNSAIYVSFLVIFQIINAKLRKEYNPSSDKIYQNSLESLLKSSSNVENVFYATEGLNFLGSNVKPDCNKEYKSFSTDNGLILDIFLTRFCPNKKSSFEENIKSTLISSSNLRELYYAIVAAKERKLTIPKSVFDLMKNLHDSSSTISNGYAYQIAVLLEIEKSKLSDLHSSVKKTLESALLLNEELALYENGAFNTALIINGIINLEKYLGKPNSIENNLAMKFANYLYSHRYAFQDPKIPLILFNSKDPKAKTMPFLLKTQSDPIFVGYSSLWPSIKDVKTKVDLKVVKIVEKLSRKPVSDSLDFGTCRSNKIGECELKLTGVKLQPGAYELVLSLVKQESSIYLPIHVNVPLIFRDETAEMTIDSFTVSIDSKKQTIKSDQKTVPKLKLQENEDLALIVKLSKSQNPIKGEIIQQCLVRFESHFHSVPFALNYPCEGSKDSLDLKLTNNIIRRDGLNLASQFRVSIFLGSSTLSAKFKPIKQNLFDVETTLIASPSKNNDFIKRVRLPQHELSDYDFSVIVGTDSGAGNPLTTIPFAQGELTNQKIPLYHTFRQPDAQASSLIATIFTAMCLCPLVMLIMGWPLIGFNLRDLPCSISVPIFHTGLFAMFVVYSLYWFKLNMFTALKYLMVIAIPTFLAGNTLLRTMVSRRSQQL